MRNPGEQCHKPPGFAAGSSGYKSMTGGFFIGINGVSVVDLISRFSPGRNPSLVIQ